MRGDRPTNRGRRREGRCLPTGRRPGSGAAHPYPIPFAMDDSARAIAQLFVTALGDFLSDSSGLGFLGGALLVGGLLVLVVLATFLTRISRVLLFWIAFVLTRPFGATVGDVLTKARDRGGLALGRAGSSAVLAA